MCFGVGKYRHFNETKNDDILNLEDFEQKGLHRVCGRASPEIGVSLTALSLRIARNWIGTECGLNFMSNLIVSGTI